MEKTSNTQITNYRFVVGSLIALLGFSAGLNMLATGPITPLIIDTYGINNSTAGLLTSIIFIVKVVFAIPSSMLIDRLPLKTIITLGGLTLSAPLLSFLAVDSFSVLVLLRAVHGLGFILVLPAAMVIFMQQFKPKELPLVNGSFTAAMILGITMSNFFVVRLSAHMPWEVVLSICGGVALISTIVWVLFGNAYPIAREGKDSRPINNVSKVLSSRDDMLLIAADLGPLTLFAVSAAWLPTFYHETLGFSLTKAGGLMSTQSLAGFLSLLLASFIASRTRLRRPFLIVPGILAGFAGIATVSTSNLWILYIDMVALGFVIWFYLPVLFTMAMELHPDNPSRAATIFSVLLGLGGISAFIGPPAVGAVADLTGSFVPGIVIFSITAWSLLLSGILLPETKNPRP